MNQRSHNPKPVIRTERTSDHAQVTYVIESAFRDEKLSNHDEHHLVDRLRRSDAFVPELSLVAILDDEIVGHILLTRIVIRNEVEKIESLALAPVSVLPKFQGRGIGTQLIETAHQKAADLEFRTIVVVGHAQYYPRFGYTICQTKQIHFPFDVPIENGFIKSLQPNALSGLSGTVEYPKAFFD